MQTKVNIQQLKLQAILFLLLANLLCSLALGQSRKEELFAPVPTQLRGRLVERLKLLVEYQRTQQWEKQYDLLSELVTQGKGKDEFVKLNRHYYSEVVPDDLILDFTPKSVTAQSESVDYGEWTIFGCARLHKKGRVLQLYGSVSAYRQNNDWYFSQVGLVMQVGGQPENCPYEMRATNHSTKSCTRAARKRK
jgi:hypothetical protein